MSNARFNLLERRFCKIASGARRSPASFGTSMRQIFHWLARSKRGATAIEYGLIAALVAVACMTAITSVADNTIGMWGYVKTNIVPKEE